MHAGPVREEYPVEMDIPVLRVIDGHFRRHVYKCPVHFPHQTVRLWVVRCVTGRSLEHARPLLPPDYWCVRRYLATGRY
ncbi:hypothetical protein T07_13949 [Trichinella nelsoni]|uniref:Uncharacterized protein n=1 Tax=Trichinella nelsoni TaxID=6336 RepID=A0A0V0RPT8_9BILA|nr:hypothetical protein T07_13949 [Trichinella nelsoni]